MLTALMALFLTSWVAGGNIPYPWSLGAYAAAIVLAICLAWKTVTKRYVLFGHSQDERPRVP